MNPNVGDGLVNLAIGCVMLMTVAIVLFVVCAYQHNRIQKLESKDVDVQIEKLEKQIENLKGKKNERN
jgi:uncharacterized membrane protein YqhA